MYREKYCLALILVIIDVMTSLKTKSRYRCHAVTDAVPRDIPEAALGETDLFPWLGVIKVFVRDEGEIYVALSGIVLITDRHILANADEIAKMPKWIFKGNVKAMFIPFFGKTVHISLLKYITHPEFLKSTRNTVALVTVKVENGHSLPLLPVCWTSARYENSKNLYIVGFTDEYGILEKFIYEAKKEDTVSCDRFFEEEELNVGNRRPVNYMCASTTNMRRSCVWDTGNALVSNSTGFWVLVGFGVNGPGCAMPGRFLDVLEYLPWIWSKARPELERNIKTEGSGRRYHQDIVHDFSYPFDTEQHHYSYFQLNRTSPTETVIHINDDKGTESCHEEIYREAADIESKGSHHYKSTKSVTYKLSLYDLHYNNITCVRIKLKAERDYDAYMFVESYIQHPEGGALSEWGDTPRDILQSYPLRNGSALKPKEAKTPGDWSPGPHLEVDSVKDHATKTLIPNHNIYMTFTFRGKASYHIRVYAPKKSDADNVTPDIYIEEFLTRRPSTLYHKTIDNIYSESYAAVQYGRIEVPRNRRSLFSLALHAAVVYSTYIATAGMMVCNGDARLAENDEINRRVETDYNRILRRPHENTIKAFVHAKTAAAKRNMEDYSGNATVTAFGNASSRIPEPFKSRNKLQVTAFSNGKTTTTARIYDHYTTTDTYISFTVYSNHTSPFGFIITPRSYVIHRWCIWPITVEMEHKCYFEHTYNDDNLPPEFQYLG